MFRVILVLVYVTENPILTLFSTSSTSRQDFQLRVLKAKTHSQKKRYTICHCTY